LTADGVFSVIAGGVVAAAAVAGGAVVAAAVVVGAFSSFSLMIPGARRFRLPWRMGR
jgi:hypothetical protein